MKNSIRISAAFSLLIMLCSIGLSKGKTQITKEDIVGVYSYSHRWGGSTISLNADGTFQYEGSTCTYRSISVGTYLFDGKFLVLTSDPKTYRRLTHGGEDITEEFDKKTGREKFSEPEITKYLPVRWGDRLYLMTERDVIDFCNAINLGFEPRNDEFNEVAFYAGGDFDIGFFYSRKGDENKSTTGLPELPEEYQQYLLPKPLSGKILKIEKEGVDTVAQINLGLKDGIKETMVLLTNEKTRSLFSLLTVVSVQEDTAKVQLYSEQKVGDKVFTQYQGPRTLKDLFKSDYFK